MTNLSKSLGISLITAIVLKLTNISYVNISLFAILIFCVSLLYLSSNKVIEGIDAINSMPTTNNQKANNIMAGIGSVLADNDIDVGTIFSPDYIKELTDIVSSISHSQNPLDTSTSGISEPGSYIDTTSRTKNSKLLDVYYNFKSNESCSILNESDCVDVDNCIWVNNKSNTGGISLCERGDKSGPYPKRNPDGSLFDVDYDYYKIK